MTATPNNEAAGVRDDALESLIENSGGWWVDDLFKIEGPYLMQLLRDAAALTPAPSARDADGEVVAWAVRWQQGPNKRATQVFTDHETAHGFYDWRKGSPCSEPVEFLQLMASPPASVPVAELVALAEKWRQEVGSPTTLVGESIHECADELTALAQKGDARGQG